MAETNLDWARKFAKSESEIAATSGGTIDEAAQFLGLARSETAQMHTAAPVKAAAAPAPKKKAASK